MYKFKICKVFSFWQLIFYLLQTYFNLVYINNTKKIANQLNQFNFLTLKIFLLFILNLNEGVSKSKLKVPLINKKNKKYL